MDWANVSTENNAGVVIWRIEMLKRYPATERVPTVEEGTAIWSSNAASADPTPVHARTISWLAVSVAFICRF
jgi:hypothetical protein